MLSFVPYVPDSDGFTIGMNSKKFIFSWKLLTPLLYWQYVLKELKFLVVFPHLGVFVNLS